MMAVAATRTDNGAFAPHGPRPMPPPLVFVYGNLRRGDSAHARLRAGAVRLGPATIRGRLYDLGPYPAARPSCRPCERVRGERYRLTRPAALAALDSYEDCNPSAGSAPEYRRALERVDRAGRRHHAWVYWYARPLRGARRAPGGVWRP
jgi:gamma-glutamylcyclotransferase (GGCT)/AIG2-like uncharacterized protein YtfP